MKKSQSPVLIALGNPPYTVSSSALLSKQIDSGSDASALGLSSIQESSSDVEVTVPQMPPPRKSSTVSSPFSSKTADCTIGAGAQSNQLHLTRDGTIPQSVASTIEGEGKHSLILDDPVPFMPGVQPIEPAKSLSVFEIPRTRTDKKADILSLSSTEQFASSKSPERIVMNGVLTDSILEPVAHDETAQSNEPSAPLQKTDQSQLLDFSSDFVQEAHLLPPDRTSPTRLNTTHNLNPFCATPVQRNPFFSDSNSSRHSAVDSNRFNWYHQTSTSSVDVPVTPFSNLYESLFNSTMGAVRQLVQQIEVTDPATPTGKGTTPRRSMTRMNRSKSVLVTASSDASSQSTAQSPRPASDDFHLSYRSPHHNALAVSSPVSISEPSLVKRQPPPVAPKPPKIKA